jgi:type I restriction enzyme S subunit
VLSQNTISEAYRDGWILETQQDFVIKGRSPKSDSWKEKIPSPYLSSEEDNERFGGFPKSWAFVSLDQVTRFVKDGPHFSPEYTESGIPFISGRNVTQNGIDFATCKFISAELHDELSKRCKPVKGDILYTKGGTTGIACVNKLDKEFNVWVHVAVLRVSNNEVIDPNFIALVLNSPKCYEQSQHYTHGVANRDLGLKRMIKICFAIPHIDEQTEIVRRVESLFVLADTVEKQYLAAKQRLDRLSQSLLAKAFRGELVPQDPNDEPAAELLKRIQAERQAQPAPKQKRSKPA